MTRAITIAGREVSAAAPCFVIAEIGVNHNGDLALAHRLVDAAADAGADAVKFQSFRTDALVSADAGKAAYQQAQTGGGTQADMLRALELSPARFAELAAHCRTRNVAFMSTAFDPASLDDVLALAPPCLKWPSGELTNLPFLRQAARAGLPLILSTGMATLAEVATAMAVVEESGTPFALLQCVSNYPARLEEQNLRAIPAMAQAFGCPAGLADHTSGPWAAIAARGLGMCVLEKHITLDRTMAGPDHAASAEPDEFAELVLRLRQIEAALGDGIKRLTPAEADVRRAARRSLFYATDLPQGHILCEADLAARRPGTGIAPDGAALLIGRPLRTAVSSGRIVSLADVG